MHVGFLNPPQLCTTFGWTHFVSATGGKTIHISGHVGLNERGEVIGRGDLRVQTEQAFKNTSLALAAVGATFRDVVKTSLFVVGLKPEHVPIIRELRSRYVNAEHPPASTLGARRTLRDRAGNDEGRRTKDEGRRTKDEGRRTKERRKPNDESTLAARIPAAELARHGVVARFDRRTDRFRIRHSGFLRHSVIRNS